MYLCGIALFLQGLLQLLDITRGGRTDVGIESGCGKALIFAELRQNLRAQRYVYFRIFFLNDFLNTLFVCRIEEGEQEAYGNGLDLFRLHFAHRLPNFFFVQRNQLCAVRCDNTFGDAISVMSAAHRIFLPRNVLDNGKVGRTLVTGDVNDVAVAFGCNHAGAAALVLENHVCRNGRAVENLVNFSVRNAQFITNRIDALHHADGRVVRGCRGLIDFDFAAVIYIDKVGKCTADIDAYSFHVVNSCLKT